jgi:hypothetical protein
MLKFNKEVETNTQLEEINSIHPTNKSNTMKNLVKHVVKFGGATLAIAMPLIASSYSANAQVTQSALVNCQNQSIRISQGRPILTASCQQSVGANFRTSSIVLNGYQNREGALVFDGNGTRSSFQNSCNNIQLTKDASSTILSAGCRRSNGSVNRTTIRILNIEVRNGSLAQI